MFSSGDMYPFCGGSLVSAPLFFFSFFPPSFPRIIIKLAFMPVRYTGEWLNGFAHGRGAITFVRVDRDAQEELWVRGVCLRLVPSVSFQLSGHDDEKLASKRSVNSILTTHSSSLTSVTTHSH